MSVHAATRRMVMGLGNTLNRDEGLGVHALHALEKALNQGECGLNDRLEFVDGGVLGLNLLPWVEECSHLLVLDAVNAGKPPGTVIELTRDTIPLYTGIKLSDHQVTFQEVLGIAKFRDKLPPNLHLIGIQPADIRIGVDLSATVQSGMPEVLARAAAVLREWNLLSD